MISNFSWVVYHLPSGIPVPTPRAFFAAPDDPGVIVTTTDASGVDGLGGYVWSNGAPQRPLVVSEPWPPDILAALAEGARPREQRDGSAPRLSVPVAELFAIWATACAASPLLAPRAVIAVGDCQPAANALNAASSSVPQMAAILRAARREVQQWLGVHVVRELNRDADTLSHPTQLASVLSEAHAAGLHPQLVRVPLECWETLRQTMLLPDADSLL